MNELPLSIFSVMFVADLVIIAYALYGINFDKTIKVDKILATIISAPLSFILANSIINGNVVQTYADASGYHYIPIQSQPLNYFLLGIGVLMALLSVLLIIKYVSDHFENLEKKSALGEWK